MAEVTFSPNHMPPPACYPADINGLLDLLTTGGGLNGTIPDTAGGGVFVGSAPPPSALTNKVWYKTDGAGRPIGVYMFYNGNWRKVYTGAAIGEIRMAWFSTGLFDATGRGIIGGDLDGWALCNGQNGTPNLTGYFLTPGVQGQYVGQQTDIWYTDADGGGVWRNIGGQKGPQFVQTANLPPLVARGNTRGGQWQAGADGGNLAVIDGTAPTYTIPVVDGSTGIPGGGQALPFPVAFVAVGFIMFIGYQ